jgi:preprotein translocase subunit SecG
MLETILIILHVLVSLFLIFVVLLQSGQAADLAGAFGGGGSQTALGMRSAATLLQKLTTVSAIVFMLTSLSLGIVGRTETSVIDDLEPAAPQVETTPTTVLPTETTTPTTMPPTETTTPTTTPTTIPPADGTGSGQQDGGQGSGR